jgi:hypothetical protein
MPTYTYKCDNCGSEYDTFESMSAPTEKPCIEEWADPCEDDDCDEPHWGACPGTMRRVFKLGQRPIIRGGTPKFHK